MSQILTMAVQNLNETDRDDMVHYMKQAMVGTFFERWLKMGGWINSAAAGGDKSAEDGNDDEDDDGGGKMSANTDKDDVKVTSVAAPIAESVGVDNLKDETDDVKVGSVAGISEEPGSNLPVLNATNVPPKDKAINSTCKASSILYGTTINEPTNTNEEETEKYTSAAELEKLIRAIGTNPNLDIKQKNLTIQGLRDSVWKSNCRLSKRKREEWEDGAMVLDQPPAQMAHVATTVSSAATSNVARAQPETVAMQQTHHMR